VAAAPIRARRRPRRWWLFRPFDLMARLWPVRRRARGVLVIRMDGIGDMVLFQGAFRHYPEALGVARSEITVLGGSSWASLAATVYEGCRFRAIDEHAYDKRPLYRLRISLWVRRQGFAVAVCDSFFRKPLVADTLVYVSGAKLRIVAQPYISPKTEALFDWHLSRVHRVIETGPYPTHESVRHFRFVSELAGRKFRAEPPALRWRRGPRPLEARYAVLNLGSNEPGRRWPLAGFLEIAEHLAQRGLTVVFTGGRVEAGLRVPVAKAARLSRWGGSFVDRIASTTLAELLDLQQHAELVISSDTGPAHLAIGLGTPTIVIVGGGHFTSFVPYPAELTPPQVRFVWHEMACYHCFWLCTQPHAAGASYPCLDAVSVAQVRDAADELLAQRSENAGAMIEMR
jgi:ADP-heptose:LPS heptosyltransferase